MADTIHQIIEDSEENYLNTTFWDIQPLFLMLRDGMTKQLKAGLNLQLDSIPQIASLLRFCDQSHFTLVFRKK